MKKTMIWALVAMMAMGCEESVENEAPQSMETKRFTFSMTGDFVITPMTRTASDLSENELGLTDLWLFDYMDGVLVQQLHQASTDADFGAPSIDLAYGEHHVYFVASKGVDATLNTELHKITWGNPKDTFWKDFYVNVTSSSNGNRSVVLERVATRLRITAIDEVPEGIKDVVMTPSVWYYGLDYVSGEATDIIENAARTVAIPSSYVGTSGNVSINILGLSPSTEWSTDVSIVSHNSSDGVIGSVSIADAPLWRNKSTNYSGSLFSSGGLMQVSLNADWNEDFNGTW